MQPRVHVVLIQQQPDFNFTDWLEAGQGLALLRKKKIPAKGHWIRTDRQRRELAGRVARNHPRIVFIAIGRGEVEAAMAFLQEMGDVSQTTTVVIGGAYGTLACYELGRMPQVRAVLLGEWVEALVEFSVHVLKSGDAGGVPGSLVRDGLEWQLNDAREYQPRLDKWPDPAIDDFRAEDLFYHRGGNMPIHASRGFPFETLFSTQPQIRHLQKTDFYYYLRPPMRVVEEARRLRDEYKVRSFQFVDEMFPWTPDWVDEFSEMWKREVDLPFRIRSASEYLDGDRLTALRRARLSRVELCVEGGNEELRQHLSNVNQTNERVLEAVKMLREYKVEAQLRLMLSVPGETTRTLKDTIKLARDANAHRTPTEVFHPWPDSPQWRDTERRLCGVNATVPRGDTYASIANDVIVAANEVMAADSVHRAGRIKRPDHAVVDSLADFPLAVVRAPYEGSARLDRYFSADGKHEVVALRVPAEISWQVRLPEDPIVQFGLLLRPELPGERTREPISFSIRIKQEGRNLRLFQKVIIQALDPDSRRWHWFRLPISGVRAGEAVLVLENLVFGQGADYAPETDIWAGWGRVLVFSKADEKTLRVYQDEHPSQDDASSHDVDDTKPMSERY